ncbi:MAG: molybdopterin-dependent oxidoreductase [Rhodoferax sp.]|jgi:hypothetical protein|nr:molybdopterin-dependent oxidoreductase [Rhodoferax sp.]
MSRLSYSFRRLPLLLAIAAALGSGPALALDAATGKIILTITGKVGEPNSAKGAEFDMAMLEKLPQHTMTTQTPWEKTPTTFSGPLLRDVLAAAKASGTNLKAVALNDYKTSIPFSDTQAFDMVLASRMNGKAIPVRTKGPLFIVYPYDTRSELRSTTYYERSAWQLRTLTVE